MAKKEKAPAFFNLRGRSFSAPYKGKAERIEFSGRMHTSKEAWYQFAERVNDFFEDNKSAESVTFIVNSRTAFGTQTGEKGLSHSISMPVDQTPRRATAAG